MDRHLFSFGHGYSAKALSRLLMPEGWQVTGTTRSDAKAAELAEQGIAPITWPGDPVETTLSSATHILTSIAPKDGSDPVLDHFADALAGTAPQVQWLGYLSTIGVYGDHQGGWVDETTPLAPATQRGQDRVAAEAAWRELADRHGLPLHIFRIAGIYGPGRGPFEKVRSGKARRIIKPGQVFSRIHVEDIAQVLYASISAPRPGAIYNLCDDDPAPPQDVLSHAAKLLGLPEPPSVAFENAKMSPMARSFYAESKRVKNDLIKDELGVTLKYPNYRVGLKALLDAS